MLLPATDSFNYNDVLKALTQSVEEANDLKPSSYQVIIFGECDNILPFMQEKVREALGLGASEGDFVMTETFEKFRVWIDKMHEAEKYFIIVDAKDGLLERLYESGLICTRPDYSNVKVICST